MRIDCFKHPAGFPLFLGMAMAALLAPQSALGTSVVSGPNWVQRSPAAPPTGRFGHAMAYDATHQQVVLFGGLDFTGILSDTWVWDGTNWTQKFPLNSPPARDFAAMTYDAARQQVVLFGGHSISSMLSDTWVWDGSNWTQQFPAASPTGRFSSAEA